MTRFLLVFTLLTLTVPITTEPAANGGTREVNQTSLGTAETSATEIPTVKRANLTKCTDGTKMLCYVGSNCIDGEQDGKHANFTILNVGIRTAMAERDFSFRKGIEACDLGVTLMTVAIRALSVLVFSDCMESQVEFFGGGVYFLFANNRNIISICSPLPTGGYELEFHPIDEYLNLPLVIVTRAEDRIMSAVNGELVCSPSCEVTGQLYSQDGNAHFWSGKARFNRVQKRVDMSFCFKSKDVECFVGDGCLDGGDDIVHSAIVNLPQYSRTYACMKQYSLEYHTTSENVHLVLSKAAHFPGLPRVSRKLSIVKGKLRCEPRCEFNETSSGANFVAGDVHIDPMSDTEAEEYERSMRVEKEESNLKQRRQEEKNKRRAEAIAAALEQQSSSNSRSREGTVKSREAEPLIPTPKVESDLFCESAKDKSGRDDE